MFLIVIDVIMVGAIYHVSNRGLLWQSITMKRKHLNDFDLADDVALLNQRCSDTQSKLNDLAERFSVVGLTINASNTKSLDVNTDNPCNLTVAGQAVEKVEGSKIDNRSTSLRNIWRSNQINQCTRIRVFNSNMKSVLLYVSETWCESAETTQKLQVFINRCLRFIIRTWWLHNWISNTELHRRCHQEPMSTEIRERKWSWVGYTLRKGGKRNLQTRAGLKSDRTSQQSQTHELVATWHLQGNQGSR
ncbi:uncharacterized protein LOC134288178 [Aedes albopictus]|uniref:DUF6451 domain-containing protein n=1 Tax=Aedes albopictus TaxID=7160 RepID=A0ABM1YI59_AEDAL